MKEALKEFIQTLPEGNHGLRFFEMPTGSGKTFGTIEFMKDFILNPENFGIKRIMYLTNIKNNLNDAYKDLKERFDGNESIFFENVLKITANLDSVIDHILEVDTEDDITKMLTFRELKSNVQLLKRLESLPESSLEEIENFKKNVLGKAEKAFRLDLEKYISKWNGLEKDVQKIKRIKKDFPWLLIVYPAILTSQRKVLFITTDKFHAGNNPIISKAYRFSSNTIIKDSLVIIDESDKAKMHLLNRQIQNATDYQLDLLQAVCSIHKSFTTDDKPEELFIQIDQNEIERTTRRAFEKTKAVFEDAFVNHNLNYQFKLSAESESKNFFIFHDFDPMTISNSKEASRIYIKKDDKRKLNLITKDDKKSTDRLASLIGSLVGAVNYFIKFVCMAADNYSEAKNKNLPLDEQIELEDAISTVLSVFGLEQGTLETLKRIAINAHRIMGTRVQDQKDNSFGYDLYDEGFQLYSFLNDTSHDLNTKIMMSFLDETPEKFLKNLAYNSMVACISATAGADTVLNNFNLRYLKEALGENMSFLPKPTVDRLRKKYLTDREKNKTDIKVKSVDINSSDIVEMFSKDSGEKQQLQSLLDSYPDSSKIKNDPLFDKKRFVKTAIVVKDFTQNPKSSVMLVLTPRLLKPKNSPVIYNEGAIENVLDIICKNKKNIKRPTILQLTSKNSVSFLSKYKKLVDAKEKIIIFSSYSTAGTGQNLQYSIFDENGDEKKVDIDTIYLEKPTFLLSIPTKNMSEAELSGLIYENLSLATNQEKTFREAKAFIKGACQVKEQSESEMENNSNIYQNYECDSVNNAGVVIVKQAIGRISRTNNQDNLSKNKFIYIDREIFNSFSFEQEKHKFNTLEFQEVVKVATAPIRKNQKIDEELNRSINMCDITRSKIHSLLKTDRDKWLESNANKYREIREFFLKHPTLSRDEMIQNKDMRIFYLKAPNNTKINSYWFKRSGDSDEYKIEKIAFEKAFGLTEASDNYVKLSDFMKIDFVKDYFEKNDYATSFAPNEYILLPNLLDDIYRGALGETVGRVIFEKKIGIPLEEISDLSKFEKFDFCLKDNKNIYIDFKHWSKSEKPDLDELEKISRKKQQINAKAVFIINVMSPRFEYQRYVSEIDKDVMIIPWLVLNKVFGGPTFDEKRCQSVKKDVLEVIAKYGNFNK